MNQDNPFAKGVSINQDIVMEDEMTRIERFARSCHEKVVDAAFDAVMSIAQSVPFDPNYFTEEKAIQFNNTMHRLENKRQLLALGREEE